MKTNKLFRENRLWGGVRLIALFLALLCFVFAACKKDPPEEDTDIAVTFNSVTADGFAIDSIAVSTTRKLTLNFSQAIDGLSGADIDLGGVNNVAKGTFTNSGSTYTLSISGFTSSGNLSVSVSKDGYKISGSPKVDIFYSADSKVGTSILALPRLREQFAGKFLIGNIFNPSDATSSTKINTVALTRHFDVLTPENAMKPNAIATSRNSTTGVITYNTTVAKRMVDAATASQIKVVGHTLLWHQQNAAWMSTSGANAQLTPHNNNQTTKDANLAIMKAYISGLVGHADFKGKIYAWDVLNEAFPDSAGSNWGTAMRPENPWFAAIGSDFVYEAFHAARIADPAAILLYNDYNLNNSGKATAVKNMVSAINTKYENETNKPSGETSGRLLIEGIGMQSHHNTGVSVNSIEATLNLFKPLGVQIHISELDVLAQGYSQAMEGAGKPPSSGNNLKKQAELYYEYMKLYVDYADIIERVTLWGLYDLQSWRSAGQPLLFDATGRAKMAYDAFVAFGDKTVVNPDPDVEPINLVPSRFGDADSEVRSVTVNDNGVVTIKVTDQKGFIGFYYVLPPDWNEYSTLKMEWTANVTSTVAKLAVKKGIAQDSALVGTAVTSDKYKDVKKPASGDDPAVDDSSGTWIWDISWFVGMNSPGITFQINVWNEPEGDIPQDWTFQATSITLE